MKSKSSKTKEMTVDELAIIMAKSFSNIDEKFIAIDGRFDDMDKKMNYHFESLTNRIDDIADNNVKREEYRGLEVRVSKIEKKFKIA